MAREWSTTWSSSKRTVVNVTNITYHNTRVHNAVVATTRERFGRGPCARCAGARDGNPPAPAYARCAAGETRPGQRDDRRSKPHSSTRAGTVAAGGLHPPGPRIHIALAQRRAPAPGERRHPSRVMFPPRSARAANCRDRHSASRPERSAPVRPCRRVLKKGVVKQKRQEARSGNAQSVASPSSLLPLRRSLTAVKRQHRHAGWNRRQSSRA